MVLELPLPALPVVLPEPAIPAEPPVGALDGELEGELAVADPALDGLAALFRRGRPFESRQCVDAEMLLLLDCAEIGPTLRSNSIIERRRDWIFIRRLSLGPRES